MPTTTDRVQIRAILNSDRAWSAYALGDLSPGFFEHCDWHIPADGSNAIVMLYRGVDPPILFAHGDVPTVERLAAETVPLSVADEAGDGCTVRQPAP